MSQRTFSLLPPLSPQFINVGQVFLSESVLKCHGEGVFKKSLKSVFSRFKISHVKPNTQPKSVLTQVRVYDLSDVSVYIVEHF